jgi:catechol 2,3-dioxygenase-like lactoylglutathione lyase family enzyme
VEVLSSRVILCPQDRAASIRFYEDVLGLPVYREWGAGEGRCVVFFLGGGLLELSGSARERHSETVRLFLQVRDLAATRQLLDDQGVAIEAEPERKPWGLDEMTCRDPDGLELVFVEVPIDHPLRRRDT